VSDTPLTGPINEFGDLSRRARRALEAQGINPDEALAQFNETGDIAVLTGSIPIIVPISEEMPLSEAPEVEASPEPEVAVTAAPSAPDLFPAPLSRRDESLLEQRVTAEIDVVVAEVAVAEAREIAEVVEAPDVAEAVEIVENVELTEVAESPVADEVEPVADIDTLIAAVVTDDEELSDVVSEAPEVTSQDIEPVPFDGGPLADVEDVIAIDRSDDTESTISEYEAFQITTTSTGVIPTTGHTLVLPTLPEDAPNVIAALNSTGEIVITGQITLPVGVPTATDPTALDAIDLDSTVEPELVTSSNDLAPVSATAAVSSVAGPTGVVSPVKRRSERLPVVLAIAAAILAAGVVALFVANLFIPVFK